MDPLDRVRAEHAAVRDERIRTQERVAVLDDRVTALLRSAPAAPEGDVAFARFAAAWICGIDAVPFLHPAVQQAVADTYADTGIRDSPGRELFGKALLPASFYRNYDRYHLLRWRSNLGAVEQMMIDFPTKPIDPGVLPDVDLFPSDAAEELRSLVARRASIPVVMRRPLP